MREAGWRATSQKLFAKAAPYAWWAVYAVSRGRLAGHGCRIDFVRVQKLGAALAASLHANAAARPTCRDEARQRAMTVIAGTWSVLGFGETRIPTGSGWLADPFHGEAWPPVYFPFVDYVSHDRVCDVKIAWELSRLQFLPWLAEGALLNDDLADSCFERFVEIVVDWTRSNPPGIGVNWTCAMEVAIRAVNLAVSGALFSSKLDERIRRLLCSSLEDHFIFLERFPETSDVTGNHYLCDLMGIAALASLCEREDVFRASSKRFVDECDAQFEADGVHLERAPVYHRLCMDVLTIGGAFIHARDRQIADALAPVFGRALNFAQSMADSRGWLPVFGDADGGMVLHFQNNARDISDLCALEKAPAHGASSAWVRGIAGDSHFLSGSLVAGGAARPLGGFASLKIGEGSLSMRVGAQGLAGRAPHDHDDATSIWVAFGGDDFIVDRGCHSYTLDASRRVHDISSSAHNVLKPALYERYAGREGSIHLTMRGAPVCSEVSLLREADSGSITACIDSAGPMQAVRREVRVDGDDGLSVEVVDACMSDVPLVLHWHFAPGFHVKPLDDARFEIGNGSVTAHLELHGEQCERVEPFDYLFASNYGRSLKCHGLRVSIGGIGPRQIISRFDVRMVVKQS